MDIVDQIRTECARVAQAATQVRINHDRIEAYAAQLSGLSLTAGPADLLTGEARERCAAYWLTLDAINFGSGWFPTLLKLPGVTGYRTIKAGVDRRFRDDGPWSAKQLQRITAAEISTLTGQEPNHPLMLLFKESLRDLGRHVAEEGAGSFASFVDRADGSAVKLVEILGAWDCFADASEYQGRAVPFLKRAQIVAADLQRANAGAWRDSERLTLFADNLVPHVLRLDGVLAFDPELVARIDAEELLEHNSSEEVEIRACAVQAVELLAGAGERLIAPYELDELLWNRGQQPKYKAVPRHRSRCTAY